MSIPTVYIRGTKKQANETLSFQQPVRGVRYSIMEGDAVVSLADMPSGTVIKFWVKKDHCGTPIAKSYGNWNKYKNKID